MGQVTGKNGIIKIDDEQVVQVKSWNLDETGDTVETTVIGQNTRTFAPTLTSSSGGLELFYDEDDLAIEAIEVGDVVTMELYIDGEAEGDTIRTFQAVVTALNITGTFDGQVDGTMSFQTSGAIVKSVVPTP